MNKKNRNLDQEPIIEIKKGFRKENYLNYLLTLGFILTIILFLVSITTISRFVFSNSNSIGQHVIDTKNLLENIDEVQNSNLTNNKFISSNPNYGIDNKIIIENKNIIDYSYYNINENKSIISIRLNSNITKKGNIYYIKLNESSKIKNKENIVFLNPKILDEFGLKKISVGKIISIENQTDNTRYIILNIDNEEIVKIDNESLIIGKLLYYNKEN